LKGEPAILLLLQPIALIAEILAAGRIIRDLIMEI